MEPGDWLPVLAGLADLADRISLERFRAEDLHVDTKPDRTLVTEADLAVEAAVRAEIARSHPEVGVLGEEEGDTAGDSATRLILDPIDATFNFARGIPVFATLLAIESVGEIVAGLVSAPALGVRWDAARGRGARRNGRPIRVSGVSTPGDAHLFHGSLGGYEATPVSPALGALARRTHRDRGFGDFWQHMLVAEGGGEIAVDPIVHPWDIAPIQVIVEEAGGRATTLEGERDVYGGSLVVTNGLLHDEVLAALALPA